MKLIRRVWNELRAFLYMWTSLRWTQKRADEIRREGLAGGEPSAWDVFLTGMVLAVAALLAIAAVGSVAEALVK